jgi:hypothetical protein
MGFNRRKMEDQRRTAAEKKAFARRATDAQVLEEPRASSPLGTSGRPNACRCCSRQQSVPRSKRATGFCGRAALPAVQPADVDLRKLDRHPDAAGEAILPDSSPA